MGSKTPSRTKTGSTSTRWTVGGSTRAEAGDPDAFGSERSFNAQIGGNWQPDGPPRGSYIDFRFKAKSPQWPPRWLAPLSRQLHVATVQWGLGAYERFLSGEGEEWLQAALDTADHLLAIQHRGGSQDGGWRQFFPMPHTFPVDPPWLSSIAQGEAASLLVRLHLETGEERFADAATRALLPMSVPIGEGGCQAILDGSPFLEEYPTDPPPLVLNGAIFALWGYRDVGVGLGDGDASERFAALTTALAESLHRWDTGHWSRYDLYPHPLPNIASPAYHLLHIRQLDVLDRLFPHPELRRVKNRFEDYRSAATCRRRALAQKVAFRLTVPRNAALAHRLPWNGRSRLHAHRRLTGRSDVLVLCYHAVSEDWHAALSVTPARLEAQLAHLAKRGYRGVTFGEAVARKHSGKQVAITFDDGYRSVVRLAKPILDAYGMPATVFVPTDFIGSEEPMGWPGIDRWLDGPHADELIPMSWEEARELADLGWEIGSHTCTHPLLTRIDDDQLRVELEGSRAECERRLGQPCESLAYPYGDQDLRVMEAAMAAGYSAAAALGLEPGGASPTPYCWPRVGVYQIDGPRSFRLKVSRPLRRLQRSRVWSALDTAVRPVRPKAPSVR